jgi:hypothetical protein
MLTGPRGLLAMAKADALAKGRSPANPPPTPNVPVPPPEVLVDRHGKSTKLSDTVRSLQQPS